MRGTYWCFGRQMADLLQLEYEPVERCISSETCGPEEGQSMMASDSVCANQAHLSGLGLDALEKTVENTVPLLKGLGKVP